MNWKLIVELSGFGLFMALATVFVIRSSIEPWLWLLILVGVAVLVARFAPGRYFLHGLAISGLYCVWITGTHLLFFDRYVAGHPEEMTAYESIPFPPQIAMLIVGPIIGLISGCVLGIFAFLASKVVKPAS